jgi:predicted transcriptional regulator
MPMSSAKDLTRLRRMVETAVARNVREDAGLSYGELGVAAGLHRTTIFKYERGLRRPRGDAAQRYLRVLEELSGR